jgi:DNA-directed RNA polymerase subunit RPC12/RpoP
MADIVFNCPQCDTELSVSAEYVGAEVECPSCEAPMVVPGEAAAGNTLADLSNQSMPSEDRQADGSACPNCGNDLPEGAVLCVGCGYHIKLGRTIETSFE